MDGINNHLMDMHGVILRTILVMTGVTTREQVERFPYRTTWVRESIVEVEV